MPAIRRSSSAIAAIFFLAPAIVQACSCIPAAPVCQSAPESAAVFLGKAIRIQRDLTNRTNTYTFQVLEDVKGGHARQIEVSSDSGGGSCGISFDPGQDYLIYAFRAADGTLSTNHCSRTAPASTAAADLAYLRGLPPGGAPSRVYGYVTRLGSAQDEFVLRSAAEAAHPLANIPVRAESTAVNRRTVTDARGNYSIELPPGNV